MNTAEMESYLKPEPIHLDMEQMRWAKRYHKLIGHPTQLRLEQDLCRFKVVPAGRRSGKTERAKRKVIKAAMRSMDGRFFCAAPTRDQAKRIYWEDIKLMMPPTFRGRPSESELIMRSKTGSEIHIIGMDKPQRFEGVPWDGGIVDEFADMKEEAWQVNIRPALDTLGREAWCWLIGVPDGLNHYYDLAMYAKESGDPDWGFYTWLSSDILPAKTIEAAKRQLSPRAFRQEYEASFETASGRVYDDYSDLNHTKRQFKEGLPILWAHDFNFVPLSSVILQQEKGEVFAVDEIVLEGAVTRQAGEEFKERYKKYKNHPVVIYGDASGRAGEKHGHISDYLELKGMLEKAGFKTSFRVPKANPAIKDSQSSLRGKICNAMGERTFYVNPAKAPTLDKGLKTTQLMKGSTFQEEETFYQHITTAARYFTAVEYPVYGEPQWENW